MFQNLTSLEDVIAGNNTILEISNCTSLEILNLPSTLQHVKLENIQSVVFKTEITEENCTTAGMETLEESEIEFTPPSSMPWPLTETVNSSQMGSTSGSGTGTGSGNNLAHDNEQDSYAEHHRDSSLIMGLSDNSLENSPMSKANKGKAMKSNYLLDRPLWDFKFYFLC